MFRRWGEANQIKVWGWWEEDRVLCKWDTYSTKKSQLIMYPKVTASKKIFYGKCIPLFCLTLLLFHYTFFIILFFNMHSPPPSTLPEALSLELPRFFIKELRLKLLNYYKERQNAGRSQGASRGWNLFFAILWVHLCLLHLFAHVSVSALYPKDKKMQSLGAHPFFYMSW